MVKKPIQESEDEFQPSVQTPTSRQLKLKPTTRKGRGRGRPPFIVPLSLPSQPIFKAEEFPTLTDLDFCVYLEHVNEQRLFGVCLMDEYGKFYFLSKTGCEHLEACLNNFETQNFLDLIVSPSRARILKRLSKPITKIFLPATIYSKNNKRKWPKGKDQKETQSVSDTYYKFLKSVLLHVRPVKFTNTLSENDFQLMFQDEYVVRDKELLGAPKDLFLVETRLATQMEKFGRELLDDPILQKYMNKKAYTMKKDHLPETGMKNRSGDEDEL